MSIVESPHHDRQKPNTEPTERSNSPEIIRRVIPNAIIPTSGVNARKLLMLPRKGTWRSHGESDHSDHEQNKRPELRPRN